MVEITPHMAMTKIAKHKHRIDFYVHLAFLNEHYYQKLPENS